MNCPRCGNPLRTVELDAKTAPWLCHECHRGWWNAELTPVARDAYRWEYHDFGHDRTAQQIHRDRDDERSAAMAAPPPVKPKRTRRQKSG